MTNLKCSVVNCYHNQDKLCCLSSIKVEGAKAEISESTECSSFKEKSKNMSNSCKCAHNGQPNHSLMIECDAEKCMYNENNRCKASDIMVEGPGANVAGETKCATFKMSVQ